MTKDEQIEFIKTMGQFTIDQIKLATAPLRQRIEQLEATVASLEAKGIAYHGVYQRAIEYRKGAMVTHDGSLFAAVDNVGPNEPPGATPKWQLAAKRGADGRDSTQPRSPTSRRHSW
jgi:hypothetical protein